MARTFISAQGQNASNLTTPGYITSDNISTELVQSNYIIKGGGVNGKVIDTYPTYDSESNSWAQGNVSEIFTYLNAGGSNVKLTNFKYNITYGAEALHRDIELDIYWGLYVIIRISSGQVVNNLYDISELSGLVSAAAGATLGAPYVLYPEINLDTREITKLPRYSIDEVANHEWVIETDDFATTVTNTDTNTDTDTDTSADTTTSQTGGIKISELDKITNFDPADLMIISRDEDNNGTYDKSFAIDPTLLRDSARSNIGTEKPSDPKNGEFWFDENTANLYIYTEALNSWIQVGT